MRIADHHLLLANAAVLGVGPILPRVEGSLDVLVSASAMRRETVSNSLGLPSLVPLSRLLDVARLAVAATVRFSRDPVHVVLSKRVARVTRFLGRVSGRKGSQLAVRHGALDVHQPGNRLQVTEANAPGVSTQVIQFVAIRKWANHRFPEPAMGGSVFLRESKQSVSTSPESPCPLPAFPAGINLVEEAA